MVEINNNTRSTIDIKKLEKLAENFLKHYKIESKEVSIAFVGDKAIRGLNKKYRKIDKATDILSFEGGDKKYLGEIIIDYSQIKRQAKKYSKNIKEELNFILIHGLLHLLGHEDETEKGRKKMERIGDKLLKKL